MRVLHGLATPGRPPAAEGRGAWRDAIRGRGRDYDRVDSGRVSVRSSVGTHHREEEQ
jgi:hypothetical protein